MQQLLFKRFKTLTQCLIFLSISHANELLENWQPEQLIPWESALKDTQKRTPTERAKMLKELGFRHYAYLLSADPHSKRDDTNMTHYDAEAEIKAMLAEDIRISAWMFWINQDDADKNPLLISTLELFKKYQITPTIWITHSFERKTRPHPKNEEEQNQRIISEAKRIQRVANLAKSYGCDVGIYTLRKWLGVAANQIAVQRKLREWGVDNVGVVYNFSHSRSIKQPYVMNDPENFDSVWRALKPYVIHVNLVSLSKKGRNSYLSRGYYEQSMIQTIVESDWKGSVGLLTYAKGDSKTILESSLKGLRTVLSALE